MPNPTIGESKKEFMARCIPEVVKEGNSHEQSTARCNSIFDKIKEAERQRPDLSSDTRLASRLSSLIKDKAKRDNKTEGEIIEQMANAAGISPDTVKNIVNTKGNSGAITGDGIPIQRLEGFARTLGVSIDSLLGLLPKDATARRKRMKESDAFSQIPTWTILRESDKSGNIWDVVLIEEGLSQNKFKYSEKVLREAIPIFEGAKAMAPQVDGDFDHPPADFDIEGGIPKAVVGWYDLVRFGDFIKESGEKGRGLLARFHLLDDKLKGLLTGAWERGKKNLLGLSINADGFAPFIKEAGETIREVKQIFSPPQGVTVDIVTNPSAGGRFINLVESFNKQKEVTQMKELLAKLKESAPGVFDHIKDDWEAGKIQAEIVKAQTKLIEASKGDGKSESFSLDDIGAKIDAMIKGKVDTAVGAIDEKTKLAEAKAASRVYLKESLDKMKTLPKVEKDEILHEYSDRGLSENETNALLKRKQDKFASLKESKLFVPDQEKSDLSVDKDQFEKLCDGMLGMLLGETINKIPPMAGLHESYRICNPGFSGSRSTYGRNLLREAAVALPGSPTDEWGVLEVDRHRAFLKESMAVSVTKLLEAQLTTSQWTQVYAEVMNRALMKKYDRVDLQTWRKVVSNITSAPDFRAQYRIRIGGFGNLATVSEGGTYQEIDVPTDEQVSFAVTKRGNLFNLTMEAMVNDDIGAVQRMVSSAGTAAAQTLYEHVWDLIDTNANTDYDSTALFDATHNNLGTVALATANSLDNRVYAMADQTEQDSGKSIGVTPKYLLHPTELMRTSWEQAIGNVSSVSGRAETLENWLKTYAIEPIWVGYWTDANNWYLVADPARFPTIEVAFLNGQQNPEFFIQDQPNVGSNFTADKITYKIRHIYVADLLEHRSFDGSVVT